jgi:transposase-like protein
MGGRTKALGGGERRVHRWTEEEARGALAEFAASGESAAGFARRRGISSQRLAYWSKRLAARGTTAFVAVALPAARAAAVIEIAAAGVVVRVREGLDAEHVARLVEAIGRRVSGAC